MTHCRPREKNFPQLPSALGAQETYQTHQELVRRQGNRPERVYQDLEPGTPVWVQHRHNERWEPATVVKKADAPDSYWIVCENGAGQPQTYRRIHTSLKVRSTSTEAIAPNEEWKSETVPEQFHGPAYPYVTRSPMADVSVDRSLNGTISAPQPTPDLPNLSNFSQERETISSEGQPSVAPACTTHTILESVPGAPNAQVQPKSTRNNFGKLVKKFSDQLCT